MHKPSQTHFEAAKRILRYIQGTLNFDNLHEKNVDVKLLEFCDSNWVGCVNDMKNTSVYAFSID